MLVRVSALQPELVLGDICLPSLPVHDLEKNVFFRFSRLEVVKIGSERKQDLRLVLQSRNGRRVQALRCCCGLCNSSTPSSTSARCEERNNKCEANRSHSRKRPTRVRETYRHIPE